MSQVFRPTADYLPHRPPMLLIDDVVAATANSVVCRTTIHPGCVFARDGVVHPSAMIEFVAQACAIYAGVTSSRDGAPLRVGLIVGCREISFEVDDFAVGDELTIVATKIYGDDQVAVFTGTVSRRDAVCATIQLSVVDAKQTQFAARGGGA